jgi:hypothetical protein
MAANAINLQETRPSRRGGKRAGAGRPAGRRNRTKTELEQLRQGPHRLNWKMSTDPARSKPEEPDPNSSSFVPPWRFPRVPASLSRSELLEILKHAKAGRERDWLMILVAAWHGLSPAELVSFPKEAIANRSLSVNRIKGARTTTQPLVKHANPLLDEESALVDFARNVPAGQPVFNVTRQTFHKIVCKYGLLAQLPRNRANPRALKHSVAIQSLIPGTDAKDVIAEAQQTVLELREEVRKNALAAADLAKRLAEAERIAWRPDDWDNPQCSPSMAELWRSIGSVLLSREYIGNEDLGERLDAARIKCLYGPPGTLWEGALSSDKDRKEKGAINLITDIRKWVKKPGKNPAMKSGQSKK